MSNFLKEYCLTIKILSPLFIGSGKTFNKKEYLFNRQDGKIQFINADKMYADLFRMKKGDQLENYLMGRSGDSDLLSFFISNRIPSTVYQRWISHECEVGDRSIDIKSIKDVLSCIKGPDGYPYIPGSSFKGMLRTMMETVYFINNREAAKRRYNNIITAPSERNKKKYLRREDQAAAVYAFHRDIYPDKEGNSDIGDLKNDILRGVIIRDSEPIPFDSTCICQKLDLNVGGQTKPLNVLRECIKPGTIIKISMVIDTAICPVSIQDILEIIKKFYLNYKLEFSSAFKNAPGIAGNSTTMILGGGAGYPSKTISYGLASGREAHFMVSHVINETLPERVRNLHGHNKDVSLGGSPHMLKCTIYHGKLMQMGACCITQYSVI